MEKIRRIVILQKALYEQIRAIAQREKRSVSAQMAYFLQEAVAKDQREISGPSAHGGLTP